MRFRSTETIDVRVAAVLVVASGIQFFGRMDAPMDMHVHQAKLRGKILTPRLTDCEMECKAFNAMIDWRAWRVCMIASLLDLTTVHTGLALGSASAAVKL